MRKVCKTNTTVLPVTAWIYLGTWPRLSSRTHFRHWLWLRNWWRDRGFRNTQLGWLTRAAGNMAVIVSWLRQRTRHNVVVLRMVYIIRLTGLRTVQRKFFAGFWIHQSNDDYALVLCVHYRNLPYDNYTRMLQTAVNGESWLKRMHTGHANKDRLWVSECFLLVLVHQGWPGQRPLNWAVVLLNIVLYETHHSNLKLVTKKCSMLYY